MIGFWLSLIRMQESYIHITLFGGGAQVRELVKSTGKFPDFSLKKKKNYTNFNSERCVGFTDFFFLYVYPKILPEEMYNYTRFPRW